MSITLCDATRDLINAPVFAAANPDLLLVNTSRGGIVNEHDLYIALTTGQIRAAASDVFVHEPRRVMTRSSTWIISSPRSTSAAARMSRSSA